MSPSGGSGQPVRPREERRRILRRDAELLADTWIENEMLDEVLEKQPRWRTGDHAALLHHLHQRTGRPSGHDLRNSLDDLIRLAVPMPTRPSRLAPTPPKPLPTPRQRRHTPPTKPLPPTPKSLPATPNQSAQTLSASAEPKRDKDKSRAADEPPRRGGGGSGNIPRTATPRSKAREPAVLRRVLQTRDGRQGGPGKLHDGDVVRVSTAAPLDSPEWIEVELFDGDVVWAQRRVIPSSPIRYSLRYRRHARARSSRFHLPPIRYVLIELKCTLSFQRCAYWIPKTRQYLLARDDTKYYGLADIAIDFNAGPDNPKASDFLESISFELDSILTFDDAKHYEQTAEIRWTSTKKMSSPGASASTVNGTLEIQAHSTRLTPADGRSRKYITITRQ